MMEPALTAEAWRGFIPGRLDPDGDFAHMALRNANLPDDDPRKITPEMVGAIRRCAYSAANWIAHRRAQPATFIGESHDADVELAHNAADLLMALLPPRPAAA